VASSHGAHTRRFVCSAAVDRPTDRRACSRQCAAHAGVDRASVVAAWAGEVTASRLLLGAEQHQVAVERFTIDADLARWCTERSSSIASSSTNRSRRLSSTPGIARAQRRRRRWSVEIQPPDFVVRELLVNGGVLTLRSPYSSGPVMPKFRSTGLRPLTSACAMPVVRWRRRSSLPARSTVRIERRGEAYFHAEHARGLRQEHGRPRQDHGGRAVVTVTLSDGAVARAAEEEAPAQRVHGPSNPAKSRCTAARSRCVAVKQHDLALKALVGVVSQANVRPPSQPMPRRRRRRGRVARYACRRAAERRPGVDLDGLALPPLAQLAPELPVKISKGRSRVGSNSGIRAVPRTCTET